LFIPLNYFSSASCPQTLKSAACQPYREFPARPQSSLNRQILLDYLTLNVGYLLHLPLRNRGIFMRAAPSGENLLPPEGASLPSVAEIEASDATLLDLRSPAAFASGFIPGSFHLPDAGCLELLRANGLLRGRRIYLVADAPEQIARYRETLASGTELELGGWSGPEMIDKWRKRHGTLGSLEPLEADTLAVRVLAWKTIVVDTRSAAAFESARIREALRIPLDHFTGSLQGLPAATALCVVCETGNRASFAGSMVWNLGFRNVSFLRGGFAAYLESRLPLA
jgi:hydroxyacylglutathione hydrolase